MSQTAMDIYLAAAIELIPRDELAALLSSFGINEEPSEAAIRKAMNEGGQEFTQALGALGYKYSDTPASQAKMYAAARKLSKATGKAKTEYLTESERKEKSDRALEWFKLSSGTLMELTGSLGSIIGMFNGTYLKEAEAKNSQTQFYLEQQKTMRYLIIAVAGIVISIILFFIMYRMFKH